MLAINADARSKDLLSHVNLSTIQIYIYLDFQHLASVYGTVHPRTKWGKT